MFFAANAAHITSDFPNPYRYCLTKVVGNIVLPVHLQHLFFRFPVSGGKFPEKRKGEKTAQKQHWQKKS